MLISTVRLAKWVEIIPARTPLVKSDRSSWCFFLKKAERWSDIVDSMIVVSELKVAENFEESVMQDGGRH